MATKTSTKVIQRPTPTQLRQPIITLVPTGVLDPDAVIQWVGKTSRADGLTSFPELEKMGPAVKVSEEQPAAKVIKGGPLKGLSIQVESPLRGLSISLLSSPSLTATRSTQADLDSLSTDRSASTVTSLTAAPQSTASP